MSTGDQLGKLKASVAYALHKSVPVLCCEVPLVSEEKKNLGMMQQWLLGVFHRPVSLLPAPARKPRILLDLTETSRPAVVLSLIQTLGSVDRSQERLNIEYHSSGGGFQNKTLIKSSCCHVNVECRKY